MLNKYLKCSVWRLALRYDIYIYMSLGFKRLRRVPKLRVNCGEIFFDERKPWVYKLFISHCVSDVRTPVVGWRPGQLPDWPPLSSDLHAFYFPWETDGFPACQLTPCIISCFHRTFFKVNHFYWPTKALNLLKPNDIYKCRTAALTSRRYILNIYSTNIHTEYFKLAA